VTHQRAKRGPWGFTWTRASLLGALLVLLSEAVLRVFHQDRLGICEVPLIYEPDPYLGYRYIPSSTGRIRVPSISKTVEINANGHYGPEFSVQKQPGCFRIAVAGSSNPSGVWMDGERTFAMELQQRFLEGGQDVEVLNFGVDGAGRSLATLRLVETDLIAHSPDLVLVEADLPIARGVVRREIYRGYLCDLGNSEMPQRGIDRARDYLQGYVDALESSFLTAVFDHCYLVRALHRKLALRHKNERASPIEHESVVLGLQHHKSRRIYLARPLARLDMNASLERLVETREKVEGAGAELVLFEYESTPGLERSLTSRGIGYIDLRMPPDPSLVHEHNDHYNEKGHRVVGERLFRAVLELGYPR